MSITTTIRPGLLVSLSARVRGGVSYLKVDLETEHALADDSATTVARWETTRQTANKAEYEAAQNVRSKARSVVTAQCCESTFGLLCPMAKEGDLRAALAEAQRLADEFNASAAHSRVEIYALTGRISDNDVEAVRAISSEVRSLLSAMQDGIDKADPDAIREAASKAKQVAAMLSDDVQIKVGKAINQVREVARELVRATKSGETAASVISKANLDKLEAARFAVLDIGAQEEITEVAAPAPRALDLPAIELPPEGLPPIDPSLLVAPQPAAAVAIDL